ncbi:hypothetical protein HBI56_142730 [Parastagonospora nodorum]|nr:hypothetical protein HBH56_034340 [Parastagonospora nodorum]KAH3933856.1 hypothetical protein HBH54_065110 [Parastagonospora nodorum]KAH3952823.1 hypothetical protein HBH53_044950 [Parastagonospora nodorum]KAH3979914.1 hypothetical protein HBH51_055980 [Parastagonospora nodorum]KAH3980424.1 hypothetical protein HBH52_092130 [Parastagonospora nodorum]
MSIRDELLGLVFENTDARFLPRYSIANGQRSSHHEERKVLGFEPKIFKQLLQATPGHQYLLTPAQQISLSYQHNLNRVSTSNRK